MISIARPSSYQGNLAQVNSEFFEFGTAQDEVVASVLAKNIRRLLQRGPAVMARKKALSESCSGPTGNSPPLPVPTLSRIMSVDSFSTENSLSMNKSESNLRSNYSSSSLSSYNGSCSNSANNSPFSSQSSLSDMCKAYKRKQKSIAKTQVILPTDMMTRIVRDIIRMGEKEEHGIRGCRLIVDLTSEGNNTRIGRINCDPKILPTFTLRLNLSTMANKNTASTDSLLSRILQSASNQNVYIKSGYILEKIKHNS